MVGQKLERFILFSMDAWEARELLDKYRWVWEYSERAKRRQMILETLDLIQ